MKAQTQTEEPFLSFTHTQSFPLYVSVSRFLWQSKPDAMGQGVKAEGDGGSDVCVCALVSMCQCPDMCVCERMILRGSKVRAGEESGREERGAEKEGKGRAKLGVNRQGLGLVGGRARVINLLSFVLSVCFHEALDRAKVKAASLKIVWLFCSMFSPQGWPSHPWDEWGAEERGKLESGRVDGRATEVDPTSLSYQPLRPRLIADHR